MSVVIFITTSNHVTCMTCYFLLLCFYSRKYVQRETGKNYESIWNDRRQNFSSMWTAKVTYSLSPVDRCSGRGGFPLILFTENKQTLTLEDTHYLFSGIFSISVFFFFTFIRTLSLHTYTRACERIHTITVPLLSNLHTLFLLNLLGKITICKHLKNFDSLSLPFLKIRR